MSSAARWQSADQMIAELHAALDGRIRVQCPITFSKRVTREVGKFFDRHPRGALVVGSVATVGVLALLANAILDVVI